MLNDAVGKELGIIEADSYTAAATKVALRFSDSGVAVRISGWDGFAGNLSRKKVMRLYFALAVIGGVVIDVVTSDPILTALFVLLFLLGANIDEQIS